MGFLECDTDDLVLVVDLDDTLLRTDTLFENFWAACSKNWMTPVTAASAAVRGPVALKSSLASIAEINVSNLPYNEEVLAYLRNWRSQGGRLALVTGALQSVAEAVSAHLNVFDEVHGSRVGLNLKGSRKASFLNERYGQEGYIYVGDSRADIHIWKQAAKSVTVTPAAALRKQVDAMGGQSHHFETGRPRLRDYVRALRPHQWLKNALVFVPLLASHQFTGLTLLQSALAFVAFSLVASSVYVFNDLLDLEADRAHPRKRLRPFASCAVPVRHGTIMGPLLGIAGLGLAAVSGWPLLLLLGGYYLLSFAYSLSLKRIVAFDIVVLAVLYTLRVLAGSAATGIEPSMWLLAFSTFFFFMLAGVKRQAELVDLLKAGKLTSYGRGYHVDDLAVVRSVSVGAGLVSVLVLGLYADSDPIKQLYGIPEIFWGICLILLFWNARIAILTQRGSMHDDPLLFAARDPVSYACLVVAAVLLAAGTLL